MRHEPSARVRGIAPNRSGKLHGFVAGATQDGTRRWRAFRWSESTGLQTLTSSGTNGYAMGISANGAVSGYYEVNGRPRAFQWTPQNGFTELPAFGGIQWAGFAISGDGNWVGGTAREASGGWRAVRWGILGQPQNLGTLGGATSCAQALSHDGGVIVGYSFNIANRQRAFRWSQATGMQDLGTLGGSESNAMGVSADGSVVLGISRASNGALNAFRWSQATGMQNLGRWMARSVNQDGTLIVGGINGQATAWTPELGMFRLSDYFSALLSSGSVLLDAYAVSPSGRYIVGIGYNSATRRREAFVIDRMP